MKTSKNTLSINKIKTMNSFSSNIDINEMISIKGGDEDPNDPFWPPPAPPVNPDPIIPDPNNLPL